MSRSRATLSACDKHCVSIKGKTSTYTAVIRCYVLSQTRRAMPRIKLVAGTKPCQNIPPEAISATYRTSGKTPLPLATLAPLWHTATHHQSCRSAQSVSKFVRVSESTSKSSECLKTAIRTRLRRLQQPTRRCGIVHCPFSIMSEFHDLLW